MYLPRPPYARGEAMHRPRAVHIKQRHAPCLVLRQHISLQNLKKTSHHACSGPYFGVCEGEIEPGDSSFLIGFEETLVEHGCDAGAGYAVRLRVRFEGGV